MGFVEILLLAIAHARDAFSVSIYKGVKEGRINLKLCTVLGLTFGIFQGAMPLIGYYITSIEFIKIFVQKYSSYIIFLILLYIGGKMLVDAIKEIIAKEKVKVDETINKIDYKEVFILGIATSIDALGAGVSFNLLNKEILFPAILIGIITKTNHI